MKKNTGGCSCCNHTFTVTEKKQQKKASIHIIIHVTQFILGVSLLLTAILIKKQAIKPYLFVLAYLALGCNVIFKAISNIFKGRVFDENLLMVIATVGAFILKEYLEASAVMLFYLVGEFFQDTAVKKSKKSIASLMDIRPDYANIKDSKGQIIKVNPSSIKIGDIIYIKPFEKIPLDGVIVSGQSFIDTRALTGESTPKSVKIDDEVLSGTINQDGLIEVRITKEFAQSTANRIIDLVENAALKKTKTEKFMTSFSKYYTPMVVIGAVMLALIPSLITKNYTAWINRALIFLVISCPCALVISVPLTFFSAIGNASKNGILIKGSNYLDALNNLSIAVFDKTATLTEGVFEVTSIIEQGGYAKEQVLEYAAHAEAYSSHPIAQSILKAYNKELNKDGIKDYKEQSGLGVQIKLKKDEILAGSFRFLKENSINVIESNEVGTKVYVALNGEYIGAIIISDKIKEDSYLTINRLREDSIKTVMLTGDNKNIAQSVFDELELDEFYSELLPDQKLNKVEELNKSKTKKQRLAFIGDGINDAPVLKSADIGIAMGGLGSDAAIEAADIVFMTDQPSKLIKAKQIAKKTRRVASQNIIFALSIKAAFLALSAFGFIGMLVAIFADTGVALLTVLNSLRASK